MYHILFGTLIDWKVYKVRKNRHNYLFKLTKLTYLPGALKTLVLVLPLLTLNTQMPGEHRLPITA